MIPTSPPPVTPRRCPDTRDGSRQGDGRPGEGHQTVAERARSLSTSKACGGLRRAACRDDPAVRGFPRLDDGSRRGLGRSRAIRSWRRSARRPALNSRLEHEHLRAGNPYPLSESPSLCREPTCPGLPRQARGMAGARDARTQGTSCSKCRRATTNTCAAVAGRLRAPRPERPRFRDFTHCGRAARLASGPRLGLSDKPGST
jgi:hypothetical protein